MLALERIALADEIGRLSLVALVNGIQQRCNEKYSNNMHCNKKRFTEK